jgi:hypothetical protein
MEPAVSVVIPTPNRLEYLDSALASRPIAARNTGARATFATGTAFIDDDASAPPGWRGALDKGLGLHFGQRAGVI